MKPKDGLSIAGSIKNHLDHKKFKREISEAKELSRKAMLFANFPNQVDVFARNNLRATSKFLKNLADAHESLRIKHNLVVSDLAKTKKRLSELEEKFDKLLTK